jgi:hypothetical protein
MVSCAVSIFAHFGGFLLTNYFGGDGYMSSACASCLSLMILLVNSSRWALWQMFCGIFFVQMAGFLAVLLWGRKFGQIGRGEDTVVFLLLSVSCSLAAVMLGLIGQVLVKKIMPQAEPHT